MKFIKKQPCVDYIKVLFYWISFWNSLSFNLWVYSKTWVYCL